LKIIVKHKLNIYKIIINENIYLNFKEINNNNNNLNNNNLINNDEFKNFQNKYIKYYETESFKIYKIDSILKKTLTTININGLK
jgi:hypothetical protein